MIIQKNYISYVFLFSCLQLCAKTYFSEYQESSTVIKVGGKEFESHKKLDNGVNSQTYSINRVPVEKEQYYDELNKAKLVGMNQQEQDEQRKQQDRDAMRYDLQHIVLEKLIVSSVHDLVRDLAFLGHASLQPYVVFEAQGIRSQADLTQMTEWAQQIEKNIKKLLEQSNLTALRQLADDIESRLDAVHACLKKSIQKATKQCDDTSVLKELLALIAE